MIKLVIFDLDGTLLNTIDDLGNSCNYILSKHGFPTHSLDSYRFFVGNGVRKLVERALPEDKRSADLVDELKNEFIEYYSQHSEDATAPYEGIPELLEELQSRGVKLAVASNKFMSGTQALVKKYFKDIEFVSVFGQREGIPAKPDPRIVYDIIEESGVQNKTEILYIGDTGVDMQTCTSAGVKGVGVLWGFRPKEELEQNGAEYLVEKPQDIISILDNRTSL